MLPIATTTTAFTTPPPIVNTTTPGTNETHVPPTTVAPSFSSSQVDNNARGNPTITKTQARADASQSLLPATANVGVPQSTGDKFTLGAQTNFLAQLIGQEITPSVRGVLVQYENLVNISNVKYKPSDAFKPEAEPSGLFGKLLQSDPPQQQARTAATLAAAQNFSAAGLAASTTQAETAGITSNRPVAELQNTARSSKSQPHTFADDLAEEEAAISAQKQPASGAPPRAISAYISTASRVNSQSLENTSSEDAVSQVA